ATENLMMAGVSAGGDRQVLHERLRTHSLATQNSIKEGGDNDLLERLRNDPAFGQLNLGNVLDPSQFVGRAPEQVDEFLAQEVVPLIESHSRSGKPDTEVNI